MLDQQRPKGDPCDEIRRPGDGAHAWLGMAVSIGCALAASVLLGWAAWRWW